MFSEVRVPEGALNGGLEALLGSTWVSRGTLLSIGAPLWLQVCLWGAKSDDFPSSRVVEGGRGERFAAEVGPLELKLRELCLHFIVSSARPATSDEVRRIYRLRPCRRPPLLLQAAVVAGWHIADIQLCNPQSAIRNQQVAIRNSQLDSATRNSQPQLAICNLEFAIP